MYSEKVINPITSGLQHFKNCVLEKGITPSLLQSFLTGGEDTCLEKSVLESYNLCSGGGKTSLILKTLQIRKLTNNPVS